MTEDHLDMNIIGTLQDVMGDQFQVLLTTFFNDSRSRIEELKEAIEAGNQDAVRTLAHSLKGSSGNVGAYRMSELCQLLEQMCHSDNTERYEPLRQAIDAEYCSVHEVLQQL